MRPVLDPKPFLLYETVEMMFKYINNVSFSEIRNTMRRLYHGFCDEDWTRRMERLQEIMEDCCRDLDPEDEDIQYFFRRVDTGCVREFTSLARVMTLSFLQFRSHDLAGEIQALKDCWSRLQTTNYAITGFGVSGLEFRPLEPGQQQKTLFMQIYSLDYPAEFKMELLKVLQDYDAHLDWLARVISPYAARLEAHLAQEPWLMQTTVDYWSKQFETVTPEEFLGNKNMLNQTIPEAEERRVCFTLMYCSEVFWDLPEDSPLNPEQGLYIFGCAVVSEASLRRISGDADRICSILRSISDKNKFEILRRLSQTRSYCKELAEELHCDKGNLSRSLTVLHSYGFLVQEPEQARVYYHTDIEGVEAFLQEVRLLLTGQL